MRVHHGECSLVIGANPDVESLTIGGRDNASHLETSALTGDFAVLNDQIDIIDVEQVGDLGPNDRLGARFNRRRLGGDQTRAIDSPNRGLRREELGSTRNAARVALDEHIDRGRIPTGAQQKNLSERGQGLGLDQCGPNPVIVERGSPTKRVFNSVIATQVVAGESTKLGSPQLALLFG